MTTSDLFAERLETTRQFFGEAAGRVAEAGLRMAERFARGGRLLAFGEGAQASDASHVAVEFVHPVLVGKRALPAIALSGDVARNLAVLGRQNDICLAIDTGTGQHVALAMARDRGMLTLRLTAGDCVGPAADFVFAVRSANPLVIQETHETVYHVLWELVQLFFEHGVTGSAEPCTLCGDEARPATVREVDVAAATARVEVDGALRTIGLDFVESVAPGDRVLVHQGFAIARVAS